MSSSYDATNEPHATDDARCGAAEDVRQAFAALPFEQKIATLLRVELDMLGDAINTVVSVASKAADNIVDAFSGDTGSGSEAANGSSTAT